MNYFGQSYPKSIKKLCQFNFKPGEVESKTPPTILYVGNFAASFFHDAKAETQIFSSGRIFKNIIEKLTIKLIK
jgi:hypothetical protein